jgi:hypothetical protein
MSSALTRPAYLNSKLSLEEIKVADEALKQGTVGNWLYFGGRRVALVGMNLEKKRELALSLMGIKPQYKKPFIKKKAK